MPTQPIHAVQFQAGPNNTFQHNPSAPYPQNMSMPMPMHYQNNPQFPQPYQNINPQQPPPYSGLQQPLPDNQGFKIGVENFSSTTNSVARY